MPRKLVFPEINITIPSFEVEVVDDDIVIPPPPPGDSPTTGSVTITGDAIVGTELGVDLSSLNDPDGLGSFEYQWQASETGDLWTGPWSTNEIITLSGNDEGLLFRCVVDHTDQAGNVSRHISDIVGPVEAQGGTEPPPPPTGDWSPENLGERMWSYWRASDLAPGTVSSWPTWMWGQNATGSARKENNYVRFGAGDTMSFPRARHAYSNHKAMFCVFRWDSGEDLFVYANGATGDHRFRQGGLAIEPGPVVVGYWSANENKLPVIALPIQRGTIHAVVYRRIDGDYYGSIDGGPETHLSSEFVVGLHKHEEVGRLGGNLGIDIFEMAYIQGDLSERERDKLMGWAHHRYGSALPPSHPYASVAPTADGLDWVSYYDEDPVEIWDALKTWFTSQENMRSNIGDPVDLSGWSMTFEDHFEGGTVQDEESALPANWYAAVHKGGAGLANTSRWPGQGTFIEHASELEMKCFKSGEWKGSVITSLNLAGHGWTVEAPFYCEVKWRSSSLLDANGDILGSWHAPLWFLSADYVRLQTHPYNEIDVLETYAIELRDKGECRANQSIHRHDPRRDVEGRYNKDSHGSHKVRLLDYPAIWPGFSGSMFDLVEHTCGFKIDEQGWAYTYFDGKEVGRYPMLNEVLTRPLMVLIDNALHETGVDVTTESSLFIDYVRVYTPA